MARPWHMHRTRKAAAATIRHRLRASLSEDAIQRAVLAQFQARRHPGALLFHIPNGGRRDAVTGAQLKALGVLAGMPDLGVVVHGVTHYLELKRVRGRRSDDQKHVMGALEAAGCPVAVAFGLDAALMQLEAWGAIR